MTEGHSTSRLRFGFALVGLARRWRRALDERMAEIGLSDAAWPPLVHLDRSGEGASQGELAARCGIDGSTLVRLLDLLETRGLVERRVSPTDRRARLIYLTPAGRETLAAVYDVLKESEIAMLADVEDAELASALDVFGRVEERLAGSGKTET